MAKGKLRKLFTAVEILQAAQTPKPHIALGKLRNVNLSRQAVAYWIKQLNTVSANGTPQPARFDRELREDMQLRSPSVNDDIGAYRKTVDNSCILVIPDIHAPYQHPDTIKFLTDVRDAINPTRVINLGDETDGHALSFHDSDPNLDSAGVELHKAQQFLRKLNAEFPDMDICHSNHGSLIYRRAIKSGIPVEYIKSYRDILFGSGNGLGWSWLDKIEAILPNGDKCIFQHQSSGDALANAAHERAHLIEGHQHGIFNINYRASTNALYWALISGCLIDNNAMAFAYGKLFPKKPIIGCSAIIDSQPMLIPMPLSATGRYTGKLDGVLNNG